MNTNQKVITGMVILGLTATWAAFASSATNIGTWVFSKTGLTQEQKDQFAKVETILDKKKAWETLTSDEQALLDQFEANRPQGRGGHRGGPDWDGGPRGMGWEFWPWMSELTDAEKTALESMSDTEKKAFFETKRTEEKAKMEARDAVMDKLLNYETLSDADKAIVEEIKADRVKQKAQRLKMEEARTLMEKERNGETLTSDEQVKLTELKASMPQRGGRWQWHESGSGSMTTQ